MPAASWRIIPARNISRWDAISASFGFSRRMGRKYRDRRMKSLEDLCLAGLVLRRRSEAATAVELQGPVPPAKFRRLAGPVVFICSRAGFARDKTKRINYGCFCDPEAMR